MGEDTINIAEGAYFQSSCSSAKASSSSSSSAPDLILALISFVIFLISFFVSLCVTHRVAISPETRSKSKRNHPPPSFLETSRVDGVKAPLHLKTRKSCVALGGLLVEAPAAVRAADERLPPGVVESRVVRFPRLFTPSTRLVSRNDGGGWFLFDF